MSATPDRESRRRARAREIAFAAWVIGVFVLYAWQFKPIAAALFRYFGPA